MLKLNFLIVIIFAFLISNIPYSFAQNDQYSLSHFTAKGTVEPNSPFGGKVLWTIIDGDKGTIVGNSPLGLTIIRLDVEPHYTCYDSPNTVCLNVTATSVKNTQFIKVGDNAVLVFEMPDKQAISIMSGDLETLGIRVDIDKFRIKDISKIVKQSSQDELTEKLMDEAWSKFQNALELMKNDQIQRALLESNEEFGNMDDTFAFIDEINEEWISAEKDEVTPFMGTIISNQISEILRGVLNEDKEKTESFVYEEIFLTNSFGANIAQTGKTTDYKQWDENWWLTAKRDGVYFGKSFDESAGVNSLDMSVRMLDENGRFLGVMKYIINADEIYDNP